MCGIDDQRAPGTSPAQPDVPSDQPEGCWGDTVTWVTRVAVFAIVLSGVAGVERR